MDTDEKLDLRSGIATKLLLKEETHQIIGCAFEVINELGHGFHEKPYENALVVEFGLKNIPWDQQNGFQLPIRVFKFRICPGLDCIRRNHCGHKSHSRNYGTRTRPNDQLSSYKQIAGWFDS